MLPWGAQIVPDASPVQQVTVPGGMTYDVRMLFLSEKLGGQPIPDTSPVQQITVPGGRTYDVRMLFLLTCWGANPFLTRHLCSKSLFQEVGLMMFACYFD